MTIQIEPYYHAKYSDLLYRKSSAESLLEISTLSEQERNMLQYDVDTFELSMKELDKCVKEWMGLEESQTIDRVTGFIS